MALDRRRVCTKIILFFFLFLSAFDRLEFRTRCVTVKYYINVNKKLSYCWETVRRESMPRIAEMDVEMTT